MRTLRAKDCRQAHLSRFAGCQWIHSQIVSIQVGVAGPCPRRRWASTRRCNLRVKPYRSTKSFAECCCWAESFFVLFVPGIRRSRVVIGYTNANCMSLCMREEAQSHLNVRIKYRWFSGDEGGASVPGLDQPPAAARTSAQANAPRVVRDNERRISFSHLSSAVSIEYLVNASAFLCSATRCGHLSISRQPVLQRLLLQPCMLCSAERRRDRNLHNATLATNPHPPNHVLAPAYARHNTRPDSQGQGLLQMVLVSTTP
jgi:hypothetical protein